MANIGQEAAKYYTESAKGLFERLDALETSSAEQEDNLSLTVGLVEGMTTQINDVYNNKNVAEMKTNAEPKIGDIINTFGFYSFGDGGRAKYQVVANTGVVGNDITLFDLPNTLQAKLLHGLSVRAEQIGIQGGSNFNNTPFVIAAIKEGIKDIYFRSVEYQFDELLISYPSTNVANINLKLHGGSELAYNQSGFKSTVFTPYRTGQKFIVKFGGDANFTVANAALTWDVYNSGMIDIALSDSGKPTTNACLALEYVYSSIFSIGLFDLASRGMYIKNVWELAFHKLIVRNTAKTTSAVYIDTPLADGLSNTSSCIFKEVYIESLYNVFLETSQNPIMGNMSIDTITYEYAMGDYTIVNDPITTIATFNNLVKIPLFKLGYVDGLSIGQINLSGMAKRSYTNGTNNIVDSIFEFKDFFNVSVGVININDSGAYVQLSGGTGAKLSILKVNSVTSSLKNRLYNAQTTTNLIMMNTVTNGGVVVVNNSFKEKDDLQFAIPGKVYSKEDLLKLCNGTKTDYTLLYDADSANGSVFARTALSFQTFFKWKITSTTLKMRLRIKTDNSNIQIGYNDFNGTALTTDTYPITGNASIYQDFDFTVTKGTSVDSFRLIVPQAGTICNIDYVYFYL
jgi:hypothetical protein